MFTWHSKTAAFLLLAGLAFAAPATAQDATDATSSIVITTDRAEAEAYLDGKRVGLTPARVSGVSLGEHEARVEGDGRIGERRFELGRASRTINVPLAGILHPLSIGAEGALGFRGGAAITHTGLAFTYHLPRHEIGVAGDWFLLRGTETFRIQGIMGRIEYAYVPWWTAGGRNIAIRPAKLKARINIAQTTSLEEDISGGSRMRDDVAGLGAGIGLGSEVQWRRLGVEPSLYYDWYALRSVGFGPDQIRPKLDNGGLNIRIKYYF